MNTHVCNFTIVTENPENYHYYAAGEEKEICLQSHDYDSDLSNNHGFDTSSLDSDTSSDSDTPYDEFNVYDAGTSNDVSLSVALKHHNSLVCVFCNSMIQLYDKLYNLQLDTEVDSTNQVIKIHRIYSDLTDALKKMSNEPMSCHI
jgi:hypothetical protein